MQRLVGFGIQHFSGYLLATGEGDLQVARSDGSELETLASHVVNATWLPDGDHIAFATEGRVSRTSASSGRVERLWSGPGNVSFVQPSESGSNFER